MFDFRSPNPKGLAYEGTFDGVWSKFGHRFRDPRTILEHVFGMHVRKPDTPGALKEAVY